MPTEAEKNIIKWQRSFEDIIIEMSQSVNKDGFRFRINKQPAINSFVELLDNYKEAVDYSEKVGGVVLVPAPGGYEG